MATIPLTVRRQVPNLIVPAKPTPREIKQLSDLDDQDCFRFHLPAIMYYPKMEGKDPATVLKVALARALVYYYPFAGRLIEGPNNKLILDCSCEGVLFVEADADVTLEKLGNTINQLPCPYIEELLHDVPGSTGIFVGCPLVLIQVTRLICGAFVFGIRFNRCVSDAFGLVQFLNVVAEMGRGEPAPSIFPIWKREFLNARSQPRITCRHQQYEEELEDNNQTMEHHNLVSRTFFFGTKEIQCIQRNLPPNIGRFSTFDIVSACIWRSRTTALQVDSNEVVMLTYMVNVRGKNHMDLPLGYYGGTSVTTTAVSKAGSLCTNQLGYALGLVRLAKSKVTKEYVRSMMDLMVIKGRPQLSSSWNFIVSDASRASFGEADFGWGKAICGGISLEATVYESVYTRFRNGKGEEGILVPVCLPIEAMERFQEEIGKLTQDREKDQGSYSRL